MSGARTLTSNLCGKWHRRYGVAPCPVCQPNGRNGQDALTLADGHDGRLLLHCKKARCSFRDIAAAAGLTQASYTPPDQMVMAQRRALEQAEAMKRADQARLVWSGSLPITGTLAETYIRGRGITCPLPDTLRFAPVCWHPTARRLPALVALVEGGKGFAVHRTYLCADGNGKAGVQPAKAMLGATSGGAVRLTEALGRLAVAEGIETALSLACGLLRAPATIWAALSTSGLTGLCLPPDPGKLTIAPDGDAPGRAAAHALAERAHGLGWNVSLLTAPEGRDWNDILSMKGTNS